jgi:very-short-patch-repair endonuclease
VNVKVGPYAVDFLWRRERLIVETDSWRYHSSRASFEADRARDRALRLRGYEILRFTDREVDAQEVTVATSVKAHLRRRSSGLAA